MNNSKLTKSDAGKLGGLIGGNVMKQRRIKNVANYNLNPSLCKQCKHQLSYDKRHNSFCSKNCSASFNNKKKIINCLVCNNIVNSGKKYCSHSCSGIDKERNSIKRWKLGIDSGLSKNGTVNSPIRKYILSKYDNKCCLCGWNKLNLYTNKIPLVIDHIDGNYKNNKEENLRPICWNCDSLGPTFGGQNRGRGRKIRHKK